MACVHLTSEIFIHVCASIVILMTSVDPDTSQTNDKKDPVQNRAPTTLQSDETNDEKDPGQIVKHKKPSATAQPVESGRVFM